MIDSNTECRCPYPRAQTGSGKSGKTGKHDFQLRKTGKKGKKGSGKSGKTGNHDFQFGKTGKKESPMTPTRSQT